MCEDYPCCGHEMGDCRGQKYGSDAEIIEREIRRLNREDEGYYSDYDY